MIPIALAAGIMIIAVSLASSKTSRPSPDDRPRIVPDRPGVGPRVPPKPKLLRPSQPRPQPQPQPQPLGPPSPGNTDGGDSNWFRTWLDEAIKRGADPKQVVKSAVNKTVASPDKPPTIPIVDGKPLWKMQNLDGTPGNQMAVPMVRALLVVFKTLQATIKRLGVSPGRVDGRLGPDTVKAFIRLVKSKGFRRYPVTAAQLAANAVKWNEVLQKDYQVAQVGADASSNFDAYAHKAAVAACGAIGPGGRLGHFQLSPKRLEQLGIMTNVVRVADGKGGQIYDGEFTGNTTLEEFLSSPRLQLALFEKSVRSYVDEVRADPRLLALIGAPTPWGPATLSGLIALASAAGWKGAISWLKKPADRDKFVATTQAFRRLNGLF